MCVTDGQTSWHGIVRAMHTRRAVKITIFNQYIISGFISQMMQDRAIITMEGEYDTAPKLPNGTSMNDLE